LLLVLLGINRSPRVTYSPPAEFIPMKTEAPGFQPYRPRPLNFLGVESVAGYRLKVYSIRVGDVPFDRDRFDEGVRRAKETLPQPPMALGRPGVGFVLLHQGGTGDYVVLCRWDRENELPTSVHINDSTGWRLAAGGESFCVWDLRVLWWEREAYVGTVLAGRPDGVEAYLAMTVEGYA
jgi:hypothetical protein